MTLHIPRQKNWLTTKEMLDLMPFERTKLAKLRKAGQFVKPIELSKTCLRWDLVEVQNWLAKQKAARVKA
ncbi:AlpA family phage regulatory protein [Testudinibacter sp. TR-2022]|uniref:helix-turn-helix transcriptional regulator n=1 Tax=Testudinibacter sp. TR-2022 TaxID=2585029 RepID=UPI00111A0331|nr:AlpA family phage regulatory protein [Testudinibacter sp. TR-2022]TNH03478.1 AlpA family phage regulatory protein [Pasteurellaceae bacterium Phil31]TNH07949.1 AlpA family phage regulatory protein [Testudinibacter sp. TR-2022]TNH10314.1 AlpA family phage regulatory protein [Testudinibacter sp. TR-2022]